jgi:hypothetical protein
MVQLKRLLPHGVGIAQEIVEDEQMRDHQRGLK